MNKKLYDVLLILGFSSNLTTPAFCAQAAESIQVNKDGAVETSFAEEENTSEQTWFEFKNEGEQNDAEQDDINAEQDDYLNDFNKNAVSEIDTHGILSDADKSDVESLDSLEAVEEEAIQGGNVVF